MCTWIEQFRILKNKFSNEKDKHFILFSDYFFQKI
jgi:hypothetical protein